MKRTNLKPVLVSFLLAVVMFVGTSLGVDTYWDVVNGDWGVNGNWDNGEPDSDDDAYIDNDGTVTITQTGEICENLFLGELSAHSGIINMTGGDLTAASQNIGNAGTGTFNQSGGTNTVNGDLSMGAQSSSGLADYILSGGTLNVTGSIRRGQGDSEFSLEGGLLNVTGDFCADRINIALNNMGVVYTQADDVYVRSLSVGREAGSEGTYNKNTTDILDINWLHVGYRGEGTFNHNAGNLVGGRLRYVNVGLYNGSQGSYNFDALGSVLETTSGINVGREGIGIFTHDNGTVNTYSVSLASLAGGDGQYNLNDGIVQGRNGNFAYLFVGGRGQGEFNQNWGTIRALRLSLGNAQGGNGVYNLVNGELEAISEHIGWSGTGNLTQDGGTNSVNYLSVASGLEGQGTYTLNGGDLFVDTFTFAGRECDESYASIGTWGNGNFVQTGGLHRVRGILVVGSGESSRGIYDQQDGQTQVILANAGFPMPQLILGWRRGSSGEYRLGVNSLGNPALQATDEIIGHWLGRGTFRQDRGTNTCTNLTVGQRNQGEYTLNDGWLNAQIENVRRGWFVQNGGTNTTEELFVGNRSIPPGRYQPARFLSDSGGIYLLDGGLLDITGTTCAYIGDEGIGVFEHTGGGDCSIAGKLYIGYGPDGDGTYSYDPNESGMLAVGQEIRIGADSEKGRFEWFGGDIDTPVCTLGDMGTLAMGFDFDISNLANGSLFVGGMTAVSGLDLGTLEVTNGATATNNGPRDFGAVRVGSADGEGTFRQNGGFNTTGYLEINSNGRYEYTNGSLTVNDGGLHVVGELDFDGSWVTLSVNNQALVNLVDANIVDSYNASLYVNDPCSLTILPSGFSPGQFGGGYQNYGRTHTAGSTLNISGSESYTFRGHIPDHVTCSGSLTGMSGGYIDLYNGLELSGGSVDLGMGILTVNDNDSCLNGAWTLSGGDMCVGTGGSDGSFSQNNGSVTFKGGLYLGCDPNSNGGYVIDNGGTLEAGNIYVGLDANSTFEHHAGDVIAMNDLFVGYGPESTGQYVEWAVTSNLMGGFACTYVGYKGTGLFIQENGAHNAAVSLNLGVEQGSDGTYQIRHGHLTMDELNVGIKGRGIFEILSPDPNIIVKSKLSFGPDSVFESVPGAVIRMRKAGMGIYNTDANDLEGLSDVILIFENETSNSNTVEIEVAGKDSGAVPAGFLTNFVINTLQLGGGNGPGRIKLVDNCGRQFGEEALYVENLILNTGAVIELNDLNLYYLNGGSPKKFFYGDADLDGSVGMADLTAIAESWLKPSDADWSEGDFNGDETVNLFDFAILALAWVTEEGEGEYNPDCDISIPADDTIDILDAEIVFRNWLAGR